MASNYSHETDISLQMTELLDLLSELSEDSPRKPSFIPPHLRIPINPIPVEPSAAQPNAQAVPANSRYVPHPDVAHCPQSPVKPSPTMGNFQHHGLREEEYKKWLMLTCPRNIVKNVQCNNDNCTMIHVCKEYRDRKCGKKTFLHTIGDNSNKMYAHILEACISTWRNDGASPCLKQLAGEYCKYGHDFPEIRLALYREQAAAGVRNDAMQWLTANSKFGDVTPWDGGHLHEPRVPQPLQGGKPAGTSTWP